MRFVIKLLVLILILGALSACGTEPAPTPVPEPEPLPEKDWQNQEGSLAEEKLKPNEEFYPMERDKQSVYSEGFERTSCIWNSDGTMSFQNRNTLVTLSPENEIIKTVTLSKEPNSISDCNFYVTENYIFACHRDPNFKYDGVVYYTYGGEVHFANMTLYDREGNFIREYPAAPIQDDDGNYTLPVSKGDYVMFHNRIVDGGLFHWLTDTEAYIHLTFRIALYNFETDEYTTVWTKKMAKDFCPAPNFELETCFGPVDGKIYFSLYEEYGKNDYIQTVWSLDENGFERLFEGGIIDLNEKMAIIYRSDGLYCYTYNGKEPVKILDFPEITYAYSRSIYFDGNRVDFQMNNDTVFYSYFADTGELLSHDLGATVGAVLYGAKEENGVLKYYFNSPEVENNIARDCLWFYDSETGYSKRLITNDAPGFGYMSYISPDLTLMAQVKEDSYHASVRVLKIEE